MNHFLQNIKNWTSEKSEHLSTNLKDTVQKILSTSSVNVEDIATIILLHPYTHIEKKEYLGLIFNECTVKIGGYVLYLETKGEEHKYILECSISQNNNIISSYHSYQTKSKKMRVPENLLQQDQNILH